MRSHLSSRFNYICCMKRIFAALLVLLGCVFTLPAKPGRAGRVSVKQPDGSSFTMISYGDEWAKIRKTEDGCAVRRGTDGWWYYAVPDILGDWQCSQFKVGQSVPESVRAESVRAGMRAPAGGRLKREAFDRIQQGKFSATVPSSATIPGNAIPSSATVPGSAGRAEALSMSGIAVRAAGISPSQHGIVILAAFKDVSFTYGKQDFEDLLNRQGYDRNGATGSAKEYFESQFGEGASFDFDVSEIVTLSKTRAYYGSNNKDGVDSRPEEMVTEACTLAAEQGVDFSRYDLDGDGEVDNVFVFFAGEDEADDTNGEHEEYIWSHAWYVYDGAGVNCFLNGKRINRYACTSEIRYGGRMAGIGAFCHEFSHTLGLPDFYDTDYEESGGVAAALWGNTSLMDSGCYNNESNTPPTFNAMEREILGLATPLVISQSGEYRMSPTNAGGTCYRIESGVKDEFYLLECRSISGWDSYLSNSGMLLYHVDKSRRSSGGSDLYGDISAFEKWEWYNAVNVCPQHQCADIIEANGRNDSFSSFYSYSESIYYQDNSGIFFPDGAKDGSKLVLESWNGAGVKTILSDIRRDGEDILFNVSLLGEKLDKPSIEWTSIFQDAAIIEFDCDPDQWDGMARLSWTTDKGICELDARQYSPGKYSVLIDGLEEGTFYDISISLGTDVALSDPASVKFRTLDIVGGERPYISFEGVLRNSDRSFKKECKLPLRANNCKDATAIRWFYNGREVKPGDDAFFRPECDGELKMEVIWKDGSRDSVRKKIIIR